MTVSVEVMPREGMVGLLDDLCSEFAAYLVHECGLAPSTSFTYDQGLKRLERYLEKDVLEIGVGDMRRFLRTAPLATATKHSTLAAFKALDRFLVLEGFRQPSGIMALRGPRVTHQPKRPLTSDEMRVILDACSSPVEYRAIWLPAFAGVRVAEAASIWRKEWEIPARLRFLGKGRKIREVPVHPELLRKRTLILEAMVPTQGLKSVARALSHVTGIRFSPHTLRHTFSTTLRERGGKREVIGKLLGHAPLSVTESYAEVSWSECVEAMSLLVY